MLIKLIESWRETKNTIHSLEEMLEWIDHTNKKTNVCIKKISLSSDKSWYYNSNTGEIENKNHGFFSITGVQKYSKKLLQTEQPIIIQNEIGYLGFICKEINGVLNFLVQAKIEPGNINKIQISPTIQATKSNFTQKHMGKKPPYLDYFINSNKYSIIVDQIQSEQSSRFMKKRNRNIIIKIDEEIEILKSHRWITLGQIKQLMKFDNIVNMDTRTVISCIPFSQSSLGENLNSISKLFTDSEFFKSVFVGENKNIIPTIYQYINNYKMFDDTIIKTVPLFDLKSWEMKEKDFKCANKNNFKIIFCDIAIEGREVKQWSQPLFEATGIALFGLIMCDVEGIRKFLIKCLPEIGCFDKIEVGPTVQLEANHDLNELDEVSSFFMNKLKYKKAVVHDVILSEEGGRFYHEQNRNIILMVDYKDLKILPTGYFLLDYKTLNTLIQINNCVNIQLRNLLSLLEV